MNDAKRDPIKIALDELFNQYRGLKEARIEVYERKLVEMRAEAAKLQAKIVALARVCDEQIDPSTDLGKFLTETVEAGITDGVRAVLQASGVWMTPTEIRTDLLRLGYNLTGYTNIMASIHTVLSRLRKSGELKKGTRKPDREAVYRWSSSMSEENRNKDVDIIT